MSSNTSFFSTCKEKKYYSKLRRKSINIKRPQDDLDVVIDGQEF